MTKEEILSNCEFYSNELQTYAVTHGEALNALQIYADQQTAEKDKRIKELTEALSRLVFLHECEQEGLSSGQPIPEMWFEAVEKAEKVLSQQGKEGE